MSSHLMITYHRFLFYPSLFNHKFLQKPKVCVSHGLSMGPQSISEQEAILEAYSQHNCVCLWESIFHLAVWQRGPNKLGRFVLVFVQKLGVKMKWRSPHSREWECIFNLFCASQWDIGEEGARREEWKRKKKRNRAVWTHFCPVMMEPLKGTAAGRHTP